LAVPVLTTMPEFDAIVDRVLAELPEAFRDRLQYTVIHVDDGRPGGLYGLYQGVPEPAHPGHLPDHITLFKATLERDSEDLDALRSLVRETLLHEIGHHFGLSEDEVRRAGYPQI
jgi:predicted Zn-dependent protease with MMP-like domain